MKNNLRIFTLALMFMVLLTTPALAGNLDTYWENNEDTITIDPSEEANYFVDYTANSWAETIDVQITLFDDTATLKNKGVVYSEENIDVSNDPFYYSPQLTLSENEYEFSGEYFLDVKITQTNNDDTTTIRSEQLYLTVTGERALNADFEFTPANPTDEDTIQFMSTSTVEGNEIVLEEWFVDGEKIAEGPQTSTQLDAGTYDVTLEIEDDAQRTDSIAKTLTVTSTQQPTGPTANFEFSPQNPRAGQEVTFTSTSTPGDATIENYQWYRGSQLLRIGETATLTFDEPGTYSITHKVFDENDQEDEITKTIHVQELEGPSADFEFNLQNPEVNQLVTFTSTSTEGDAQIQTYNWFVNEELVQSSASSTYSQSFDEAGNYDVTLQVIDGNDLQDEITKTINVQEEDLQGPNADFNVDPEEPIAGENIIFTDASTSGDGEIVSWNWTRDGEFFSSDSDFVTSFSEGTYSLTLTVTDENNLQDSITKTIEVQAPDLEGPNADFSFNPTNPKVNEQIQFTDESIAGDEEITSWEWQIDGTTFSTNQNPVRAILEAGMFNITLTITDENDLSDSITKTINVQEELEGPTAKFRFYPQDPEVDEDVIFQSLSDEGDAPITTYEWFFNGERVSNQKEFTTRFSQAGTYNVRLTVTDENNLSDTILKEVVVGRATGTALILDELSANRNVIQGSLQHITAHVSDDQGNDVEQATITYRIEQTGQTIGSCQTNFKGFCNINPTINLEPGFYEVSATAQKPGFEADLSRELRTIFQVWQQRYTINNLETWEDEFITISDTFFRGNSVYASFDITDDFTGDEITPPTNLITDVKLKVNNIGEGNFDPIDILNDGETLEKVGDEGNFRYRLPMIPLTDDFLGDGKVFAFAFNFTDETAGQASKDVTILNNPISFNPPSTIELEEGERKTIDFKEFVSDVETPSVDITFTFEQQSNIRFLDQGQNVFDVVSRAGLGTFSVDVTADDNDGSQETRTINFVVEQTIFQGPNADFNVDPEEPIAGENIIFTDASTPGDGEIVSWNWTRDGEFFTDLQDFVTSFSEGTYSFTLTVTDQNDLSDSITKTITVQPIQLPRENPNADFIYKPVNPTVNEEVHFASTSTDSQGNITLEEWFIGDTKIGEGDQITNTFVAPDNYTVRLRVTNDAGLQDQRIQTIEVLPNQTEQPNAPTANLEIPQTTYEGRNVVLNASQSTGEIENYRFTIRRGELTLNSFQTTNPEPTYVFENTGRLTVILTVTDDQQRTDTTSQTIYVGKEYRNNLPTSTIEDLRMTNTQIFGDDLNEVSVNEIVTVATQVSNYKNEDLTNLRVSFQIPELAYEQKGNSFHLRSHESTDRSFSFRLQPGYYQPGEYMAQIVVTNTKETRTTTIPIIIN